jgi:hypothetical protein
MAASAAAILLIAFFAFWLSQRPKPQLTADDEVFKTVDALFTAVTSRDSHRLADCATRLQDHRDAGRLPQSAAVYLAGVIQKSQSGDWDHAAHELYDFMLQQRRQ